METSGIAPPTRSGREQTRLLMVSALEELGVPTRVKLLIEYTAARFDVSPDARAISDVRRAEQRRFDGHQGDHGLHVAPALEATWFQPITKTMTLLEWPLARRIIGPWSERADHLEMTLRLARRVAEQSNRALEALVTKLARSIPEALDGSLDPRRVARAAETELLVIGTRDSAWRTQAAARAAGTLSPIEARWGVTHVNEDDDQ